MTGGGADGEVVIRLPGAPEAKRVRAAQRIADVVNTLVVDPRFCAWPSGGAASFAWPGGFGPVSPTSAHELLLALMLEPLYLADAPVFPVITSGGWHLEVIHPSPPGSSASMGLYFSGPARAEQLTSRVASLGDWVAVPRGRDAGRSRDRWRRALVRRRHGADRDTVAGP